MVEILIKAGMVGCLCGILYIRIDNHYSSIMQPSASMQGQSEYIRDPQV